ncbi:hypothetical protein LTR85_006783 [Meristemomyces frigidus]|nr:hypothetical protein LTR85_006783 [Meristemomyces frigidus]
MPRGAQQTNFEVLSVIFRYIDSHLGLLASRQQRRDYLSNVAISGHYQYVGKDKTQKTHDSESLDRLLQYQVDKHSVRKGTTVHDLCKTGSAVLKRQYTQQLDLADTDEEESVVEMNAAGESVKHLAGHGMASNNVGDAVSDEPSEYGGGKIREPIYAVFPKAVDKSSESSSPLTDTYSQCDDETDQDTKATTSLKRKHSSTVVEHPEDDVEVADGSQQPKSKKPVISTAPDPVVHMAPKTSFADEDLKQAVSPSQQRAPLPKIPETLQNTNQHASPPQHASVEGNASSEGDRNDTMEVAGDKQLIREVYQPSPAATRSLQDDMATIGIADSKVRKELQKLHIMIETAVITLFNDTGQAANAGRSAELPATPSAQLETLYMEVFGGADWRASVIQLQWNKHLHAAAFLQCLISAFLVREVFRKDVPWQSPSIFLEANGMAQRFVKPALQKRGIDMQKVMSEAALAQVRSAVFQKEVISRNARLLAHNLALTLNGHLEQLVKDGVAKNWQAEMLESCAGICETALGR